MGRPRDVSLKTKTFLQNAIIVVLSCLVALILAEGLTRFVLAPSLTLFPSFHARADYGDFTIRRLRPNTVFKHTSTEGSWEFRTNAKGLRSDIEVPYEKPDGVVRVLLLGDSQTQGYEVDQDATYAVVLERSLRAGGLKPEIVNAGVSGFGTAEQLVYLAQEGMKYDPDAVVLGFFKNDFQDNVKADLYRTENDRLVPGNRAYVPGVRALEVINSIWLFRWLSQHSYLYSYLLNTVWNAAKKALLGKKRAELQRHYAIGSESINDYESELAILLLEEVSKVARQNGKVFILVDIPSGIRVPRNLRAEGAGQFKPWDFKTSIPGPLLGAFREASDVLIHSEEVFASYRGIADVHRQYGQGHLNELGHLVIGREVGEKVLEFIERRKVSAAESSQ